MRNTALLMLLLLAALIGVSCNDEAFRDSEWSEVRDSLSDDSDRIHVESFALSHHYSVGFNFEVRTDTMVLLSDIRYSEGLLFTSPDSVPLREGDQILVAEIARVPSDAEDSIWVRLVRDAGCLGWARESYMLRNVTPSDPISIGIMLFSDLHYGLAFGFLGCFIVLLALRVVSYRRHCRRHPRLRHSFLRYMPLPHINDICSPYPLLLYLTLAGSAVFYSTMQLYARQTWQHFYFHPTLNPFAVPWVLGAFLVSLWLMLLFFLATLIDMVRQLDFYRLCMYFCSMLALLAGLYVFFSLTTLYYVGYFIFPVYVVVSIWYYWRYTRPRYTCGNCGIPLHDKGVCPHCHCMNE